MMSPSVMSRPALWLSSRSATAPSPSVVREAWSESDDHVERVAAPAPSLASYLEQEARLAFFDPAELAIALPLIAELDEAGYLPAETARDDPRQAAVLQRLQRLAPPGVGARSLAECLALQLSDRGLFDPAWQSLLDNLALVAKGQVVKPGRTLTIARAEVYAEDGKHIASMQQTLMMLANTPDAPE